MFDLNRAIAKWRRHLAAAGIESSQVLDELESHLRDEVDAQMDAGAGAREAFEAATRRLGEAETLQVEFVKAASEVRRCSFVRALCFVSAAVVLTVNSWTLMQFDLSVSERIAGLGGTAVGSLYLAALPFLRKIFSRIAFIRLMGVLKMGGILLSLAVFFMFLTVTQVVHAEIGIVTHMAVWTLCLLFFLTPFAALFEERKGHGGSSLPPLFFGMRPPGPTPFGPSGAEIPLPPSDAFAPAARQSLEIAREEAYRLGHDFVGTEHVLLGVLKLAKDRVAKILTKNGLDCESVRKEIERLVAPQPGRASVNVLPLTPRARKALQLAGCEAKTREHPLINSEHILIGLLAEGGGVGARALKNFGIGIETIREEI
jgi:hypothetical protein